MGAPLLSAGPRVTNRQPFEGKPQRLNMVCSPHCTTTAINDVGDDLPGGSGEGRYVEALKVQHADQAARGLAEGIMQKFPAAEEQ